MSLCLVSYLHQRRNSPVDANLKSTALCVKMGRGQQMNVCDIEKSFKDPDLRSSASMSRLIVVVLLVVLLPFVITTSYLYYTSSDAATEAMLFFQRRHFPSFSPLQVCRLFHVEKLQIFLKMLHRICIEGVLKFKLLLQ